MIRKLIFGLFVFVGTICNAQSPINYKIDTLSSGTNIIKLRVPESTKDWRCFDEVGYTRYIELAMNANSNAKISKIDSTKFSLCQEQVKTYEEIIAISAENMRMCETIRNKCVDSFSKCDQKVASETLKKYYWGVTGTALGFLGGVITTIVLVVVSN